MKIAHLIQQLFVGGGLQVCVHNICQRHAIDGVDVHVFCCDAEKQTLETDYAVERFFQFRAITQLYPLSKFFIAFYVKHLQNKYNFDLWQIDGGYPYGAFLADYFAKNKIPCVLRCCGDDIQISKEIGYGVRRNPKINQLISDNYKKFSASVAITETVKQEYLQLKTVEETIKIIPNGVDILRLQGLPKKDIRKEHNIPEQSTIILSVGRNHPKKGYALIPEIMEAIINQGVDAYWIVIGKDCSEIKNISKYDQLNDRIILIEEMVSIGSRYELPPEGLVNYYKGADFFAMTSLLETFGIVLVEALAAGLPVVCFNSPGVRDVMAPECGAICNMNDIKAFADSIVSLVNSEDYGSLSKTCQKYAEQYSWDKIADKYFELYSRLLQQNKENCS